MAGGRGGGGRKGAVSGGGADQGQIKPNLRPYLLGVSGAVALGVDAPLAKQCKRESLPTKFMQGPK